MIICNRVFIFEILFLVFMNFSKLYFLVEKIIEKNHETKEKTLVYLIFHTSTPDKEQIAPTIWPAGVFGTISPYLINLI